VELFPRGERLRVRGVQSGGRPWSVRHREQRTGSISPESSTPRLSAGCVAAPGKFRKTRRIDVRLELLPSARKMKQGARVHFHSGTAETIAEVFFHREKELPSGASAVANLKLQDEVLVLPGDPLYRAAIFAGADDWRGRRTGPAGAAADAGAIPDARRFLKRWSAETAKKFWRR